MLMSGLSTPSLARTLRFCPQRSISILTARLPCFVRGNVWFRNGLELRVFEYLDFSDGELLDYRYVILRGEEPIRWYDSQPHPEIPDLASTFPHHLHEPPDIKRNRKPAPGSTFQAPNLPTLIADCVDLGGSLPHAANSE